MGYYAAGNRMHGAPPTGYLPIEEHGIVGDLRTVALVGTDGTVDWYCRPASTPPRCSARCWTPARAATSRCPAT